MIETLAKLTKSIYFQCIFKGFVKTPEKTRKPCIKLFTPSKIKVSFSYLLILGDIAINQCK